VASANAEQARSNARNHNFNSPMGGLPVQEPSEPESNPIGPSLEPPPDNSAGNIVFGDWFNAGIHKYEVNDCISRTPILGLP
jgi:hypothetical protein